MQYLYSLYSICLYSRLWILFFILLIKVLPNSCRGARANAHPQSCAYPPTAVFILVMQILPARYHHFVQLPSIFRTQPHCFASHANPFCVLAEKRPGAQTYLCSHMPQAVPERRLLRRSAWTYRGVGHVKDRIHGQALP